MLDFILNIFKTPAIILGIVALIGLILQRKSFGQVFSGSVKTALGMLIVSAGSSLIVNEILPFVDLFSLVFNLKGFATSSEAVVGAISSSIPTIATTSSLIMALGFLFNVLLARLSPLKYIFLTGHMMWILSIALASALFSANFSELQIILIGSLLQGIVMTILPALSQPMVKKVTKTNAFAIAHLTTIGTVVSGYIGGLLGDKNKNAEEIKLPESLDFFKDSAMSISIVIGIFYLLVTILAGPKAVSKYSQENNYIVFALIKSLGFTAGILILLQGVRMFLGELVPAFKGISDKLVPGAIPALDVPALFAYAPNSLMIGFITSVVGMIFAMFISSITFKVVPLVSIIGAFFTGGVAGIYGNAKGGIRGAIISGFIYGFLLIFGSAFLFTIFDYAKYGATGVGHDCIDVMFILWIFKNFYLAIAIIIISFILLVILNLKSRNKKILD